MVDATYESKYRAVQPSVHTPFFQVSPALALNLSGKPFPVPTFSTCFGAPFLPLPPQTYAQMLAEKMRKHSVHCYLLNSGWVGNAFGQGPRIPLKINRDNVTQILDGTLDKAEFQRDPTFGFEVPKALPGVPPELLAPRYGTKDATDYDRRAKDLAAKFVNNFEQFQGASPEIVAAGPHV